MGAVLSDIINSGVGAKDNPAPMQQTQKNDPTGTPATPYNHGANGLFYMPYSNTQLVSTLIMPRGGLIDTIPVLASDPYDDNTTGNLFGGRNYEFDTIMTGLTEGNIESFANQPTGECAVGPTGGLIKLCTLMNTMGHYRGSIREVALFRAGQSLNRLDEMAHRLINNAQALQEFFGVPDNMPAENSIIVNEMARRLFELLVSFRRFFSVQIWTGSPANNNGEAKQILGMQSHINGSNKFDVFSGQACAAANSLVYNFNNQNIKTSLLADIVEYLEKAEYNNRINAERMGLGPVEGVLVMRESLFYEITSLMPVKQYQEVLAAMHYQNKNDDSRIVLDATSAQADRDRFRNQMVLPLNGKMFRVVLDDGIPELNSTTSASLAAGEFSSDIYFVPLTVMGGMPATFFQYFNHDNQQAQGLLQRVAPNTFTFTSDGGAFRWHINYQNGCLGMNFQFAPWLKCKFPMIGWRITNVKYVPSVGLARDPYPSSSYFVNGGIVGSSGQTHVQPLYPSWLNGTAVNTNI